LALLVALLLRMPPLLVLVLPWVRLLPELVQFPVQPQA
jgi:hypothetical protein